MTTSCQTTCPLRGRLERAKDCYRAQRAEIQRLQALLTRYQRIGVRRYNEKETAQLLVGTDTLYQNLILGRALEQRTQLIQHQAAVIAALTALLRPVEPQSEHQEVAL